MTSSNPSPPAFQLIPAIDLLGDEAVRLHQGEYDAVVNRADPLDLARRYAQAGARLIHVVDLDGARSGIIRPELITQVVAAASPAAVEVGGGVRTPDDVSALLDAGAARVILGTAAFTYPDALDTYAAAWGSKIGVSLDVRDGRITMRGWTDTGMPLDEALALCGRAGIRYVVCTAISRDGTLSGPDRTLLADVRSKFEGTLIASGGIGSSEDVTAVRETGCDGAITGRALLEGRIPFSALRES